MMNLNLDKMNKALDSEIEAVRALLNVNPLAVERAILALYDRQTADEQAAQTTEHHNKIGFSAPDARRMSFVAEFLKTGKHLTKEKALNIYAKKLQKYARQLVLIAKEKQLAKVAKEALLSASSSKAT